MSSNSQRDNVSTMRTDVKNKISKLEADSLQLCLNLRNLQKTRAKLTNDAVVLSEELKGSGNRSDQAKDAIHLEPDCIRVLLDAKQERTDPRNIGIKFPYEESFKNDSCTICTCSACDDYSEIAGDIEENDLEESLRKIISTEELKGHECCSICYRDENAISECINKSVTAVVSRVDNEFKFNRSQRKVNICSACSVEEQFCNDRCEICDCELDDDKMSVVNDSFRAIPEMEERCRGGVDRVECNFRSINPDTCKVKNESKKKVCGGCECNLCGLRNVEGASPPCSMMCKSFGRLIDGNDENAIDELVVSSGDAPTKLQQICKVEKLREVLEQLKNRNHALRKMLNDCDCLSQSNVNLLAPEKHKNEIIEINEESPDARNTIAKSTSGLIATVKLLQSKCRTKDGMILALAEALKKLASPEQTDRIMTKLTNPCTDDTPIRDLDRSELWKYLRMKKSEKEIQRDERVSVEDKTSKRDIVISLLVLFFIVSCQIYRYYGYPGSSSLLKYFTSRIACLQQFSGRISLEFPKCVVRSASFIKDFSVEINAEAIRRLNKISVLLGVYLNIFSSHLTCVGALFGSLSFAKTVWSLGKKLFIWKQDSFAWNIRSRLWKFFESLKHSTVRLICYVKSQYNLFSYILCLTLGFLVSKISIFVDKWPAIF